MSAEELNQSSDPVAETALPVEASVAEKAEPVVESKPAEPAVEKPASLREQLRVRSEGLKTEAKNNYGGLFEKLKGGLVSIGRKIAGFTKKSVDAYFMSKAAVEMAPAIVDAGIDMAKEGINKAYEAVANKAKLEYQKLEARAESVYNKLRSKVESIPGRMLGSMSEYLIRQARKLEKTAEEPNLIATRRLIASMQARARLEQLKKDGKPDSAERGNTGGGSTPDASLATAIPA